MRFLHNARRRIVIGLVTLLLGVAAGSIGAKETAAQFPEFCTFTKCGALTACTYSLIPTDCYATAYCWWWNGIRVCITYCHTQACILL